LPIARSRRRAAERIDEKGDFAHLWNAGEEVAYEEFRIRPDAFDQRREDQPVDAAEGMIGDDHERPSRRNPLQIGFPAVSVHSQCLQRPNGK
jgi:hypothetical protein